MQPKILSPGIAAAVSVETGQRVHRARLQGSAKDVSGGSLHFVHPVLSGTAPAGNLPLPIVLAGTSVVSELCRIFIPVASRQPLENARFDQVAGESDLAVARQRLSSDVTRPRHDGLKQPTRAPRKHAQPDRYNVANRHERDNRPCPASTFCRQRVRCTRFYADAM
jgi:hypothetical protein